MKRITVKAYEKALIFKNGKLINVLSEGKHWIKFGRKVQKYDITEMFYHEIDLELLLKNEKFAGEVDVQMVRDNEILLQFKDGNLKSIMSPGTYCKWKDGLTYDYQLIDLDEVEASVKFNDKILSLPGLTRYLTKHVVESYEKALLYIDGKFEKILKPGKYFYWKGSKLVTIKKADLRTQYVEISGQELLTKDKAAVRLSVLATYKINDIMLAMDVTKDYVKQVYLLIQMAIRSYVGQYTLDELLVNKTEAGAFIMKFAKDKAKALGVDLENCGIRDIILPGDVKEIMNQVLIAEKKAQANVIMRREETASTRSLLNTAKLMENNEMLFRLKEMEYIEKISEKIGEITINGGSQVMDQIRSLVSSK